jgi:hypothetical protein
MEPTSIIALLIFFAMGEEINSNRDNINKLNVDLVVTQTVLEETQQQLEVTQDEIELLNLTARENYDKLAYEFNGLYEEFLRLGTTVASTSARDVTVNGSQEKKINNLSRQVNNVKEKADYLDELISTLHP